MLYRAGKAELLAGSVSKATGTLAMLPSGRTFPPW